MEPHQICYPAAEALDRALGDPGDPTSPTSFAQAVAGDEQEQLPFGFLAALLRAGAFARLIPSEIGGSLEALDENLMMLRVIARRDLTAAIAFGQTFLGAIPVWLAGSDVQKHALARSVGDGQLGCLALTEEAHGGDLLACEFAAAKAPDGYRLSGRKWLINNAGQGATVVVYARTGPSGMSAFSLFFLDKRRLADASRFRPIAKIRTHGIRGADICGFACDELPVGDDAVVGAAGRGYELTLKTLQISRAMCAGLSLGAADTALRTALGFALERRIFGGTVAGIPPARAALTGMYADLLVAECVALSTARGLHACPDRAAVWSSIVKFLVPTIVERLVADAAVVLGARHYLREGYQHGIFQKCLRDNAVVGLFDGSTAVNLHIIAGQLPALAARRAAGETAPELQRRLGLIFDHGEAPRTLPFPSEAALRFTNSGYDEIVDGLVEASRRDLPGAVAAPVRQLVEALAALDARVLALQGAAASPNSQARFDLARRYALMHAAASCVLTWVHTRTAAPTFFNREAWLLVCLQRVLRRLGVDAEPPLDAAEAVFAELCRQFEAHELFSLARVPLARPGA